jgi:hypothetical protein
MRFEVLMVVNIKTAVFWEVTCKMTAALKMIKIVNWNFMPDFDVGIMTNEYVPD